MFTVKDADGKELQLDIRKPTGDDYTEAQAVAGRAFNNALKNKAPLRDNIVEYMQENGVWNEDKERKFKHLQKEVRDKRYRLKKGGMKISEAKELAMSIKKDTDELQQLLSLRNKYDNLTADGIAETARFNCLISLCTVYNDSRERYYKSYQEYLTKQDQEAAFKAAELLAEMLYGLRSDYEHDLVENKFLKRFNMVDDQLRLVNDEGKLIDAEGREIDEEGRFVKDGQYVDIDGRPVDADGNWIVDEEPFLDDDGNPVE